DSPVAARASHSSVDRLVSVAPSRKAYNPRMMNAPMTWMTLAAVFVGGFAPAARADMMEKTGIFGGLKVTYKVVLPHGYDASRAYPTVLVFTGGPQTLQIATSTVQTDCQQEAERRGYIVIGPASPNGELFFEGAERVFPEFLDAILKNYKVQ